MKYMFNHCFVYEHFNSCKKFSYFKFFHPVHVVQTPSCFNLEFITMANRKKGNKQKTSLVFDPIARRKFLGGFQKRKQERKAKAQEELKKKLKEERQRIKQEAKESYKKMVLSHRGVPEVEHLLEEKHETDNATVKIVELSSNDLAKQNNWIGSNTAQYGDPNDDEDDKSSSEESESEEIPGMSLKEKSRSKKSSKENSKVNIEQERVFKSAKDIKKIIKKESTKSVKKSKAFQLKNKLERHKSLKKSKQQKKLRIKAHEKRDKKRKRGNRSHD